jgi:multidrug efflux pump subunit AcrB
MLAARWLKQREERLAGAAAGVAGSHPGAPLPHKKTILERIVDSGYMPVERLYVRVLRFVMAHRWIVVTACLVALGSVPTLAGKAAKGFMPANDEAQFEVLLRAPEGTSLEATKLISERVARDARAVKDVASTLVTIGDNEQKQPNVAKIYVRLTDPEERDATQVEVMDRVRRDVLAHVPAGVRASAQEVSDFGFGSKNAMIAYVITGPDIDKLTEYGKRAAEGLGKLPGVVDLDTNIVDPAPEANVYVDRERAADLGVNAKDVASTLNLLVGGVEATTYQEDGEQYDVYLRAKPEYRADVRTLGLITVPSKTLGSVPLSDVVRIEEGHGPAEINRLARQRQVTLYANLTPGHDEGATVKALEKIIADLHMPGDYQSMPFGRTKEMARTQSAFAMAFLMSFIFMYMVLAAQFESWIHPLTIILTLPLTLPFALISIILFKQQLDIFSLLGLLVLFGVVKKNAILQIDQTNQLRANGLERGAAIIEANRSRLRPILMTTLAFVAGMLPLVFAKGIGSGYSNATAGIIVGGQSLSLLLTLLATPVIYSLFDDASGFFRKYFGTKADARVASGEANLDALIAEGESQIGKMDVSGHHAH